ncbi:MAG: DUF5808 domain-containing protein, partial [Holophagales bacterium]|nr:DUF5808 domain-containing protein [Holophagales bacterium]
LAALVLFQGLLWSSAGEVDAGESAASPAGGMVALLAGGVLFGLILAFAKSLLADLARTARTPGIEIVEEVARRRALARILGLAGGLVAVVMSGLAALSFLGLASSEATSPATRVFLVGTLAVTTVLMIAAFATVVPHFLRPLPTSGPQADDANWTMRLLYRSAEDPALWVRQRVGFGYTVNFSHPGAPRVLALFVLVPAMLVAALLLAA